MRQGGVQLGAARVLPCLTMVVAAGIGAGASSLDEHDPGMRAHPAPVVDVRLTAATGLPRVARDTLVREVAQIWAQEGVRVQWASPLGPARVGGRSLRVLVIPRSVTPADAEGHTWPVGELLPGDLGEPIAIVSITAANRVVAFAGYGTDPSALEDRRLGLVLGRAVAHEIGHYLLGTRSHSPTGLMRAHIGAGDFADLRQGGFTLDDDAGRWIRADLANGAPSQVLLARFRYE